MNAGWTKTRLIAFLFCGLFLLSSSHIVSNVIDIESSTGYITETDFDSKSKLVGDEGVIYDTGEILESNDYGKGDWKPTYESILETDNPDLEIPSNYGGIYDSGEISSIFDYEREDWRPSYDRSTIEWRPIEESATYHNIEFGSDSESGSIETTVYNSLTGVENIITPEFSPTPETMPELSVIEPYTGLFNEPIQETIYGGDGRILVESQDTYPWNTICKLYISASDGTNWVGSGAIIDDFHVLTAGHCAFLHDNGGWASSIEIVPAMDTSDTPSDPYGHAWVTYMRSYSGWTVSESYHHDWAVLTLDRNIGTFTGWMGRMTAGSDDSIYDQVANIAGYPTDLSSGNRMYRSAESGSGATEYNHYYELDTWEGMSGSPVWRLTGGNRYILTVHAYGGGSPTSPNYGTRLNYDKFDRILTWLGEDTAPTDKPDMEDRGAAWRSATSGPITAGVTSFTVSNGVRNIGTTATGGFYVHYYASTNNYISVSDYYIGSDYITSTAAYNSKTATWTGTFPEIPEGDYYIGWLIDKDDNVDEFDESNNQAYITTKRTVVGAPPPTGYIEVTVKDSATNDYLSVANVYAYETSTKTLVDAGTTDIDGFYNVTALDIGWYTIEISRYGYHPDSKDNYINWAGDDDYLYFYLDMMPEDSGYIEVNVKDTDTLDPLYSAYVQTYNITSGLIIDTGYTDGSGFYNITGLRIGWYEVSIINPEVML
jgi:V8-like Glu-specific endopeptidase